MGPHCGLSLRGCFIQTCPFVITDNWYLLTYTTIWYRWHVRVIQRNALTQWQPSADLAKVAGEVRNKDQRVKILQNIVRSRLIVSINITHPSLQQVAQLQLQTDTRTRTNTHTHTYSRCAQTITVNQKRHR